MLKRSLIVVVLGALVFTGFSAMAKKEDRQECKADVETFCKDVKPGQSRVHDCMMLHLNELTTECRKNVENADTVYRACENDRKAHCAETKIGKRGGADVRKCLKEHENEISAVCLDAITAAQLNQ